MYLRQWILAAAFGIAALQAGQEAVQEPEYMNQAAALGNGGKLIPLEQEKLSFRMESKRNFVIAPKTTAGQTVPDPKSPVRVMADAHFVVRVRTNGVDPTTIISLQRFKVGKKDRELEKTKASAGVLPWSSVKSQNVEVAIPFSANKYGKDSFEVVPSKPLPSGEYAFVFMGNASCFGVDGQ